MRHVKQAIRLMLLTLLLCSAMTVTGFADDDGTVWFEPSETSDGKIVVEIVTDTTVTDGVVKLTYDSSALTYESLEADEAHVAMYSVNSSEDGVVRISWVAPEAYAANADGSSLFRVNFTAGENVDVDELNVGLTGNGYTEDGVEIPIGEGSVEPSEPSEPTAAAEPTSSPAQTPSSGNPTTGDSAPLRLLFWVLCGAVVVSVPVLAYQHRRLRK